MKAFPTHREEGMELRDYFAAKALSALMYKAYKDMERGDYDELGSSWLDGLAEEAYELADALLIARENK